MKKRSRLVAGVLTLAGLTAGSLAMAAPAQADVFQCGAGQVCTWHGSDYGPDSTFYGRSSSGNLPTNHRNVASSVANNTSSVAFFHRDLNYGGGGGLRLGSGGLYVNLSGQGFNDDVESIVLS